MVNHIWCGLSGGGKETLQQLDGKNIYKNARKQAAAEKTTAATTTVSVMGREQPNQNEHTKRNETMERSKINARLLENMFVREMNCSHENILPQETAKVGRSIAQEVKFTQLFLMCVCYFELR